MGRELSREQELLYLVKTEIPTIVGDGLYFWIVNTPDYKKKLSQLATAFKEMGMVGEWQTFRWLKGKLAEENEPAWAVLESEVAEKINEQKVLAEMLFCQY